MAQQPVAICPKRLESLKQSLIKQGFEESDASRRAEEILATRTKLANDPHIAPDGSFIGGFKGCVEHFMTCKGLPEENAQKMCAYIGRQAGKIP